MSAARSRSLERAVIEFGQWLNSSAQRTFETTRANPDIDPRTSNMLQEVRRRFEGVVRQLPEGRLPAPCTHRAIVNHPADGWVCDNCGSSLRVTVQ